MILEVEDLILYFKTRRGPLKAVDEVSFKLEKGKTLAIVGETGAGKSVAAAGIIRTLPRDVERYEGHVYFNGTDIMELNDEEFRKSVRWKKLSMVFQGSMNSLNPVMKIGNQVTEPLSEHLGLKKQELIESLNESLKAVGLSPDIKVRYPHELSGGMKQRVVIAMALIMRPELVLLDEPTSALDIMTQANIINLLKDLNTKEKLSYVFITHDLSLASSLADDVAVMYAGEIVEMGSAEKIYLDPDHPYTRGLLASVPRLKSEQVPKFIRGTPPDLTTLPSGCRFHPRCDLAEEICMREHPKISERGPACWIQGG